MYAKTNKDKKCWKVRLETGRWPYLGSVNNRPIRASWTDLDHSFKDIPIIKLRFWYLGSLPIWIRAKIGFYWAVIYFWVYSV